MKVPYVMTPGPTMVRENVRMARAMETTNPDLDLQFYDYYKETCEKIGEFLKTKNEVRILSGEGILGLEAACASLTEKDDRILVIDNGIFGEGFADFVEIYGGEVVFFKGDRRRDIDIEKLKEFLDKDSNFKYATVVHCDTPSGVINDISKICPMLKEKGIITVVDSVSAMGGQELKVDAWKIDMVLGGSQKCMSAPPGLSFLSMSKDAFKVMEERKTPIASYYCNLLVWKDYYKNKWFPYTPPISDIVGLRAAVDNILEDKDIVSRHNNIAKACREAIVESGLKLYLKQGYSNTVTVIELPKEVEDKVLRTYMQDKYNVIIAGSFGYLQGKVIRIGHMGENANIDKMDYTLFALQNSLEYLGYKLKGSLTEAFLQKIME
ncbi:alanine--glyoxylate aminotransferase family protein [Clostridium sporogenes]|jgi:aspartate aminotransferase-like enzyme|uniref:Serine-pyruvate aminotransferase/archaeal aspartate aminotransferase n=2 Tax=Clostridium TaxID=1485 RepID=A0A0D0ZZI0_CLOBO|nr:MULTISPECIES: alanine--glyoxylate aminotransferase family protein [Clostridium]MBE6075781.1 alanine--glyoxylate aminotransferase family protein [Clostridium lundense]MDU2831474.1 alanine--glyoxylate aminotransferase family protein [Clostridium botulinum]KIS23958.1 serine-pyruvate aminotransferase/archaeal aspartate aminotransferase [Clostridium botulinum B2 450]MDU4545879.1 alanine--glyoxylate aminotransferase family protein [Clostridium botulinum]MDU5119228.1 alanine--glyoxylate aminotrans